MKNILIVESDGDKFFIEALINHMNIPEIEIPNGYINEFDYEPMKGSDKDKLSIILDSLNNRIEKDDIKRIGILIDQDNKTISERLSFVNQSLKDVFEVENLLDKKGELKKIELYYQSIEIATFFTNVNGAGELETVLKEIKNKPSTYADCLDSWQNCLKNKNINKGIGLKQKDFDKFWIQVYIRFDTCNSKEKKQAGTHCTLEASMKEEKAKKIWNFDHECLNELKQFLRLFTSETT